MKERHWDKLLHNGIAFPDPYVPEGLSINVRGKRIKLTPLAEEMAYNLAKKRDTQYFNDPVFRSNFMKDFSNELPQEFKDARFEEIDFSEVFEKVDRERKLKESMSKEEKKRLSEERSARREYLKQRFGYAVVDGRRMEIGNWMAEPPCIFVGRGQHPLRGRWKPRISQEDVILNLGEDAPIPEGRWKEIVHDHSSMWIAKWIDKLTGKEKYVWLHESTPIQQSRSRAKYDIARRIRGKIETIRERILKELDSRDERMRQIATVCYLIDKLGMRVGDEKDEDEADTVGATTLRVEHVRIKGDTIEFSFLGKDSVPWNKSLKSAPSAVIRNIQKFITGKSSGDLIFNDINSNMVNRFLSRIAKGLTAKVFRTHHATLIVEEYLRSNDLRDRDDIEKIYHAKMANLQAAMFCNHQRTQPKNWERSLEKKRQRLKELMSKEKKDKRRIKKLMLDIDLQIKTRTYNLNTSLKNYIDPRVYKAWCDYVGIDWAKIYSKSLQRKFAWVNRSRLEWEVRVPQELQIAHVNKRKQLLG